MIYLTEFEFVYWVLFFAVIGFFAGLVAKISFEQQKKEEIREIEAQERRRMYELRKTNQKRWEQNMAESEKLFEEVESVK